MKYIYPIGYLFSDAWVIYHLIYLIASILGLFWFPIYSFHLLDVSIRSPQSRNVLKSITLNGSTLLLTVKLKNNLFIYLTIKKKIIK